MKEIATNSLILAVCVSSVAMKPMLDGRIVGGVPTTIQKHPYQVALLLYGSAYCGGSILTSNAILTAAHCTDEDEAEDFSIRAGSTSKSMGGKVIDVDYICQHEDFDPVSMDSDVAVLLLTDDLTFSSTIQAIPLPAVNANVPTGAIAVVTGWGALESDGASPDRLQEVAVHKVSTAACTRDYGAGEITSNMICFGEPQGGKDSCQGDSGGPIVYNGKQVGIVSWGEGCADAQFPGVYSNTAAPTIRYHIDWCLA